MGRRKILKDEIDELFADLWQVSRLGGLRRGFRPSVDSFRTDDPPSFTVIVDLAGINPEQVQVTAGDGALIVTGERRRQASERRVYQQIEIEYGHFERLVHLPADVDFSQAEAGYDRGLLTIELPISAKTPEPRPVPIEIRRRQG